MICTEAEAREKRCPQKVVECSKRNGDYADSGRTVWVEFSGKCVGSQCMAWRFVPIAQVPGEMCIETPRGYCGLAGKPGGAGW